MKAPAWARALLWLLAPRNRTEEVLGDLEEAHRSLLTRRGRVVASLRTGLEAVDMAFTLLRGRFRRTRPASPVRSRAPMEDALSGAGVSLLDFKVGFRMLVKYPGLTAVAGLAIAFATGVGAGTIEFVSDYLYPTIPLEDGDRMVEIWNQDRENGGVDARALHDFVLWRGKAKSVEEVGAFRAFRRNLITDRGLARPVFGAEMTAAAFGLARVPPLMGRLLGESDDQPGAPDVVVIGYEVWQSLFGGDPEVVGKTVRLGATHATIVGVMPAGFGYPLDQDVWTPLRLNALDFAVGESPDIQVVARLAPSVSLEEAQAEFEAIGLRRAADLPETHEHLRPFLIRFGRPPVAVGNWLMKGLYFGVFLSFVLLMLLVCANVALLLFARTAARRSEIVVRSALGASRYRIVAQLFVEALVLGAVFAAVGLWAGQLGLEQVMEVFWNLDEGALGFWFSPRLSPETVTFGLLLAVLAAGAAGAVPALKATGRRVQPVLQRTGGASEGLEFGRLWTFVIITQVALTVAFVPIVIFIGFQTAEIQAADMGFDAEDYLSVRLIKDQKSSLALPGASQNPSASPRKDEFLELKRRLAEEPVVSGVALTSNIPGENHPLRYVEIEGPSAPHNSPRGHRVATASVDLEFFDVLRAPIVSGRGFRAADLQPGQNVAIVNEDFSRFVLEDRNPIGRRVTYTTRNRGADDEKGPWYEIVGVVSQVAMQIDPDLASGAGIYHPMDLAELPLPQVKLVMRVGPNPTSFSPRLHEVATGVDPSLLLSGIRPLDEGAWQTELLYEAWFWVLLAAGGIGLLLALAGIYSIMAFTVSRRTREIGVRVALGADRTRIVVAIFSRAMTQVGIGVLVGGGLLLGLVFLVSGGSFRPGGTEVLITVAYLTGMLGVCMLACLVPTRRALAIEPTEALRADG